MSKFDDILATIKGDNPDLADSLGTAYVDDLESRDQKILTLEQTITENKAKIAQYATENYDLLRAVPPASDDDDDEEQDKPSPKSAKLATLDDVGIYWRKKK